MEWIAGYIHAVGINENDYNIGKACWSDYYCVVFKNIMTCSHDKGEIVFIDLSEMRRITSKISDSTLNKR